MVISPYKPNLFPPTEFMEELPDDISPPEYARIWTNSLINLAGNVSNSPLGGSGKVGDVYFCEAQNGDDTNDGDRAAVPLATIDAGNNKCTAGNDDWVLFWDEGTGGFNENAAAGGVIGDTIGVHFIGVGWPQVENATGAATAVFTISVNNIELAGAFINEATTTVEGVVVDGGGTIVNRVSIHHNIIRGNPENGIRLEGCFWCSVYNNVIENPVDDGIELTASAANCFENRIYDNIVYDADDNGIHLNGASVEHNWAWGNIIDGDNGATDFGITCTSSNRNAIFNNTIWDQTTWTVFDSGAGNYWSNPSVEDSGSFNILVADGDGEVEKLGDIDVPITGRGRIYFDTINIEDNEAGKTITFFLYEKIGGTNYRKIGTSRYIQGTDVIHPSIEFDSIPGAAKLEVFSEMSAAVAATRAIPFRIIWGGR